MRITREEFNNIANFVLETDGLRNDGEMGYCIAGCNYDTTRTHRTKIKDHEETCGWVMLDRFVEKYNGEISSNR
jgi:hypothetical protein